MKSVPHFELIFLGNRWIILPESGKCEEIWERPNDTVAVQNTIPKTWSETQFANSILQAMVYVEIVLSDKMTSSFRTTKTEWTVIATASQFIVSPIQLLCFKMHTSVSGLYNSGRSRCTPEWQKYCSRLFKMVAIKTKILWQTDNNPLFYVNIVFSVKFGGKKVKALKWFFWWRETVRKEVYMSQK